MALAEQVTNQLRAEVQEAQDAKAKVVEVTGGYDVEVARLRSELVEVETRRKDEVSDKTRAHGLECVKVESETESRAEASHRRAVDKLRSEARR